MSDYEKAKKLGLTKQDRWEKGIPHHPMSLRLMEFLEAHDSADCQDHFCWKSGGDGDNGEILMYEMDAFFEWLDVENSMDKIEIVLNEDGFDVYRHNEQSTNSIRVNRDEDSWNAVIRVLKFLEIEFKERY